MYAHGRLRMKQKITQILHTMWYGFLAICGLGIVSAFLGLLLNSERFEKVGFRMAFPFYGTVLPFCLSMLVLILISIGNSSGRIKERTEQAFAIVFSIFLSICGLGVVLAFIGMWFGNAQLYQFGFRVVSPLYFTVLPFCLLVLALIGLACILKPISDFWQSRTPVNVEPIADFKLDRYLGKWYEIARLDHSFERGLTQVTAEYSLREDGGVRVLNRGFSTEENAWKEAEGKAYFAKGDDRGYLKVSFFGPFRSSYIVFDLDQENYRYALVCGPKKSYLWILAREPSLEEDVRIRLVEKAAASGFDTSKLIFSDSQ